MENVRSKYTEFIENWNRRSSFEQELLALEATELISSLMEETATSKADLAQKIGKSRAYVTQVLSGSKNITLHTFAELVYALGSRVAVKAIALEDVRDERDCVMTFDIKDTWLKAKWAARANSPGSLDKETSGISDTAMVA